MRFNKGLVLNVSVYTDEELKTMKLGLSDDDQEEVMGFEKIEQRTFYAIDIIFPWRNNPKYTAIMVGGETSVVDVSESVLKMKIDINNRQEK